MNFIAKQEMLRQLYVFFGVILIKKFVNSGANLNKKKKKIKIHFHWNILMIIPQDLNFLIRLKDGTSHYFKSEILIKNYRFNKYQRLFKILKKINQKTQLVQKQRLYSKVISFKNQIRHVEIFVIKLYKHKKIFKSVIIFKLEIQRQNIIYGSYCPRWK